MTMPEEKGLLIVYTGPGKGKTTCALGTAFRAVGQELRVPVSYTHLTLPTICSV